jgi:hypothetical protein
MAKNQAQVQRRNGERLAGPGTGLDQLTAAQRERQGKWCLGTHERASSWTRNAKAPRATADKSVTPIAECLVGDQGIVIGELACERHAFPTLPVSGQSVTFIGLAGSRFGFDRLTLTQPGKGCFHRDWKWLAHARLPGQQQVPENPTCRFRVHWASSRLSSLATSAVVIARPLAQATR